MVCVCVCVCVCDRVCVCVTVCVCVCVCCHACSAVRGNPTKLLAVARACCRSGNNPMLQALCNANLALLPMPPAVRRQAVCVCGCVCVAVCVWVCVCGERCGARARVLACVCCTRACVFACVWVSEGWRCLYVTPRVCV